MLRIGFWCFFLFFPPPRASCVTRSPPQILEDRFIFISSSSHQSIFPFFLPALSGISGTCFDPFILLPSPEIHCPLFGSINQCAPSPSNIALYSHPPVGLSFRASACQSLSNFSLPFIFLSFFLFCIIAPPPCLSRGHFAPLALFFFIIYCSSRRVPERLYTQPTPTDFFILSKIPFVHQLLLSKSSFTFLFHPHCKFGLGTSCGASVELLALFQPHTSSVGNSASQPIVNLK